MRTEYAFAEDRDARAAPSAPTAFWTCKAFPAAVRFSGLSFSYNVAYAIFGGFTPIIVTTLMRWYPMSPAIYVVALSAMGVVIGLFLLRSPAGRRLAVMPS